MSSFFRRLSLPVFLSVILHIGIVGGLFYALNHRTMDAPEAAQPITVSTMATSSNSSSVTTQEPAPKPEPEPEPKPEPKPKPKPEPKLEPKPEPKPKPDPKPEPKARTAPKPQAGPEETEERPETDYEKSPQDSLEEKRDTSQNQRQSKPVPAAKSGRSKGPQALSIAKPAYPRRARSLGVEGRVRVQFDVNASGNTENVRILSASPQGLFEQEVIRSVGTWRYAKDKPGTGLIMNIVFSLDGGSRIQ